MKKGFIAYINGINSGIIFVGDLIQHNIRFTVRKYNKQFQLIREFCQQNNIELNPYTDIWFEDENHNKYVWKWYISCGKNAECGYFFCNDNLSKIARLTKKYA